MTSCKTAAKNTTNPEESPSLPFARYYTVFLLNLLVAVGSPRSEQEEINMRDPGTQTRIFHMAFCKGVLYRVPNEAPT